MTPYREDLYRQASQPNDITQGSRKPIPALVERAPDSRFSQNQK